MSAWTGDIRDLGRLAENLRALSEVPSQASREAAKGIQRAIRTQFTSGTDPYGEPWEPLKQSTLDKGRTPPPMTDTGRMKRGMRVRPSKGAGIEVTSEAEYLGFHQGQGSPRANVPPRHVLPEGELPDSWQKAIEDALDAAFERTLQ